VEVDGGQELNRGQEEEMVVVEVDGEQELDSG
jgi:hypothetical protein